MLKILQARLQQYVNWEIPGVQAGFRKHRWSRNQIANIHWIKYKARDSRKMSLSSTRQKAFTLWITTNYRKFLKWWEYQTVLPVSWEEMIRNLHRTNWLIQNWERSTRRLCSFTLLMQNGSLNESHAKWVIMQNGSLNESESTIKITGRNSRSQPQIYRWCHSNGRK